MAVPSSCSHFASNADVSGIGVRTAIYAQNFLCFAPVFSALRDGIVSSDEIEGITDQSVNMLYMAFAILITAIVEATNNSGNRINGFDAAIILDLSWMNNTSTSIWFLLYALHWSKKSKENRHPIPATWLAWKEQLLEPLRSLMNPSGSEQDNEIEPGDSKPSRSRIQNITAFIQRFREFLWKAPVLTIGSVHLSLMAAVGLWLWTNPTEFGNNLTHSCNPSVAIVGARIPFQSQALRILSLFIYSLLVIPGLNLIIPFSFFLAPHIIYNKSRERHHRFWKAFDRHLVKLQKHRSDLESQATRCIQDETSSSSYIALLVAGLAFLLVFNFIFLVDIELSIVRNKDIRSNEDEQWGFGQVLSLLLLVIPLRDFGKSIADLQNKTRDQAENELRECFVSRSKTLPEKETLQDLIKQRKADPNRTYEKYVPTLGYMTILQLLGYGGKKELVRFVAGKGGWINLQVSGDGKKKQISARHGLLNLVQLLLRDGADSDAEGDSMKRKDPSDRDDISNKLQATFLVEGGQSSDHDNNGPAIGSRSEIRQAAIEVFSRLATYQIQRASPDLVLRLKDNEFDVRRNAIEALSSLAAYHGFRASILQNFPDIVSCLKDDCSDVRQAALEALRSLAAYHGVRANIQQTLPDIVSCLKDDYSDVFQAALKALRSLAAYDGYHANILQNVPDIVSCLKDDDSNVRRAAIETLRGLAAYDEFRANIQQSLPDIVSWLKHYYWDVRQAALEVLSSLAAYDGFRMNIQQALPDIASLLKDDNLNVRRAAIQALRGLAAYDGFRTNIQQALPDIVSCLKDDDSDVRRAAIQALSSLAAYDVFHANIQQALSDIVSLLKDDNWNVRRAAIEALSGLAAYDGIRANIQQALPDIASLLKDHIWDVRQAAIEALSGLAAYDGFRANIQQALPDIALLLKDHIWDVRQAAIEALSGLAAYDEFRANIQQALPDIVSRLKDDRWNVRQAAIEALSGLATHAQLQSQTRGTVRDEIPAYATHNRTEPSSSMKILVFFFNAETNTNTSIEVPDDSSLIQSVFRLKQVLG